MPLCMNKSPAQYIKLFLPIYVSIFINYFINLPFISFYVHVKHNAIKSYFRDKLHSEKYSFHLCSFQFHFLLFQ